MTRLMLTEHFSREDLECHCGCGLCNITPETLRLLEELRTYFRRPIIITGACRCREYNEKVLSNNDSAHITGQAANIYIGGLTSREIYGSIKEEYEKGRFQDLYGLECHRVYVHVDTRKNDNGLLRCYDDAPK